MEVLERLTRRQLDTLQLVLSKERPERGVSLKELAASLRMRPPSALGHLTPLESLGLIERHRGKSRITSKGRKALVEYRRHHRVAETMFGTLGLDPDETCAAAREIDLAISHRTVEEICRAQKHPPACPHGQPITPCAVDESRRANARDGNPGE
jgi:DtxR family transcriptional regulator, Mn-dependent transcriptional regulator